MTMWATRWSNRSSHSLCRSSLRHPPVVCNRRWSRRQSRGPADFMRYREDVFNHALRYYSTSPAWRDMWETLLIAANNRLAAKQQIGPGASIAVLNRVMRVNMLPAQRTHLVCLQATPDHEHRSALRKHRSESCARRGSSRCTPGRAEQSQA